MKSQEEASSFREKLNEESGKSKNVESDRDVLKAQITELRKVRNFIANLTTNFTI